MKKWIFERNKEGDYIFKENKKCEHGEETICSCSNRQLYIEKGLWKVIIKQIKNEL